MKLTKRQREELDKIQNSDNYFLSPFEPSGTVTIWNRLEKMGLITITVEKSGIRRADEVEQIDSNEVDLLIAQLSELLDKAVILGDLDRHFDTVYKLKELCVKHSPDGWKWED